MDSAVSAASLADDEHWVSPDEQETTVRRELWCTLDTGEQVLSCVTSITNRTLELFKLQALQRLCLFIL